MYRFPRVLIGCPFHGNVMKEWLVRSVDKISVDVFDKCPGPLMGKTPRITTIGINPYILSITKWRGNETSKKCNGLRCWNLEQAIPWELILTWFHFCARNSRPTILYWEEPKMKSLTILIIKLDNGEEEQERWDISSRKLPWKITM